MRRFVFIALLWAAAPASRALALDSPSRCALFFTVDQKLADTLSAKNAATDSGRVERSAPPPAANDDHDLSPWRLARDFEDTQIISNKKRLPRAKPFDARAIRREFRETMQTTAGPSSIPTIFEAWSSPGEYGGRSQTVMLSPEAPAYYSNASPDGRASQGDIRTIAAVVSPGVAYALGFGFIDERTLLSPDGREFIGRLAQLDGELKRLKLPKLALTFYLAPAENPIVEDRKAIEEWALKGRLSLAQTGPILWHDYGFHSADIYLPEAAVAQSRIFFRRMIDFVEYAEERRRTDANLIWFTPGLSRQIFQALSRRLDYGAGSFWIRSMQRFDADLDAATGQTNGLMQPMYALGMLTQSADEILSRFFDEKPSRTEAKFGIEIFAQAAKPWLDQRNRDLTLKRLRKLTAEFQATRPWQRAAQTTKLYKEDSLPLDAYKQTEGLLDQIEVRREQLSKAANSWLSR